LSHSGDVLITGATGTIGRALLSELLGGDGGRVFLLLRGRDGLSHDERAAQLLQEAGLLHHLGRRVVVVAGDVTERGLGLSERDRALLRGVEVFYHSAACTLLTGGREECERVNLGGTLEALALARELHRHEGLRRFVYFSTAYSPGSLQNYHSPEDALPAVPCPANHYEWSKYESETRVRSAMREGLPATILRPSIVVGDSRTGEVSEFKVIYPFMRLVAAGLVKVLPARPESSLNLVPIDFVVRAALAICARADSVGRGFHLVARTPTTMAMLLELKERRYPETPAVKLVPPEEFSLDGMTALERAALEGMKPFLGYLHYDLTFDTRNTEAFLEGTGVSWPRTDLSFLDQLVDFAISKGYLVYAGRRGAGRLA
jgi:nucleoside-diphosphate-sugar epimerase